MIARIGKTYSFDAAHQLPNHNGKCVNPHGHTYTVRVEVEGEIVQIAGISDEGMVCDYGTLDRVWREELEPLLDHRDLNQSIGDDCWPTTAENIAWWCYRKLNAELSVIGVDVVAVEVSETPKTFARVEVDR